MDAGAIWQATYLTICAAVWLWFIYSLISAAWYKLTAKRRERRVREHMAAYYLDIFRKTEPGRIADIEAKGLPVFKPDSDRLRQIEREPDGRR